MDRLILLAGISLLAFALFGGGTERSPATSKGPSQPAAPVSTAAPRAGNGIAQFTAHRASDGHFYADVQINGAVSRMLIDTGASMVVLNRNDARRAGIQARPGEFTSIAQTAGGDMAFKSVTIDRMALGPVASRNVPAMVSEGRLPVSLLGQSFLARVGSLEIQGDEMRFR
jgi:aspartyl protease family protein